MCTQYYFYRVDEDFGPLFIKLSGYFPALRQQRPKYPQLARYGVFPPRLFFSLSRSKDISGSRRSWRAGGTTPP
jgi:hypothetical protein